MDTLRLKFAKMASAAHMQHGAHLQTLHEQALRPQFRLQQSVCDEGSVLGCRSP